MMQESTPLPNKFEKTFTSIVKTVINEGLTGAPATRVAGARPGGPRGQAGQLAPRWVRARAPGRAREHRQGRPVRMRLREEGASWWVEDK